MIKEQPASWAHFLFRHWLKNLLRQDFHAIYLIGEIPTLPKDAPVIMTPNHSSWYDGFIPYWLNETVFHRHFYILMLENQLRRYWFFQKLGGIGMKQDSPQDIRKTLAYLNTKLKPESLLVFFPQGKIIPELPGNYALAEGLRFLNHNPDTRILPTRFRIESMNERKPTLFIAFESPLLHRDYVKQPEILQDAFQSLRDRMNTELKKEAFGTLLHGKPLQSL
jgi:hypothetical protein